MSFRAPNRPPATRLIRRHHCARRPSAGVRLRHRLRNRDVTAAVTAVLELERAIVDWSADAEEMDGVERPRAMLRRMVTRLAGLRRGRSRTARGRRAPGRDPPRAAGAGPRRRFMDRGRHPSRSPHRSRNREFADTAQGTSWLLAGRSNTANFFFFFFFFKKKKKSRANAVANTSRSGSPAASHRSPDCRRSRRRRARVDFAVRRGHGAARPALRR